MTRVLIIFRILPLFSEFKDNITVVAKYKRERVTKLLFATVGQCKVIACAVFPSASPWGSRTATELFDLSLHIPFTDGTYATRISSENHGSRKEALEFWRFLETVIHKCYQIRSIVCVVVCTGLPVMGNFTGNVRANPNRFLHHPPWLGTR